MGVPFFIRELPETQILDDGHVQVFVAEVELIATMHIYHAFIERERIKVEAWFRERGRHADIIKLSKRGPLFLKESG